MFFSRKGAKEHSCFITSLRKFLDKFLPVFLCVFSLYFFASLREKIILLIKQLLLCCKQQVNIAQCKNIYHPQR